MSFQDSIAQQRDTSRLVLVHQGDVPAELQRTVKKEGFSVLVSSQHPTVSLFGEERWVEIGRGRANIEKWTALLLALRFTHDFREQRVNMDELANLKRIAYERGGLVLDHSSAVQEHAESIAKTTRVRGTGPVIGETKTHFISEAD